jgi:hypothetical protein
MFESLERASKSTDSLSFSLLSWTKAHCPNLLKTLGEGLGLAQLSGSAKHGSVPKDKLVRAQNYARTLLNTLAEVRSQKP